MGSRIMLAGLIVLGTACPGCRAGDSHPHKEPGARVNVGEKSARAGADPMSSGSSAIDKETVINDEIDGMSDHWAIQRQTMVETQIVARDVRDANVLEAMRAVPRHLFVPEPFRGSAYQDSPLPIGEEQTISQPYIVAVMSELLGLGPGDRVLEIGTGSGYQAAVLAEMGLEVYSIEIKRGLCRQAEQALEHAGYESVNLMCGDGYRGWPEHAPFDGIIVTAAPERAPRPLLDQLADGGRLVIPVGSYLQELKVITRNGDRYDERSVIPVRFVPMTGEVERH